VRVALDARKLHDGGIGTYIRGLAGALARAHPEDEWNLLVSPAERGSVPWEGPVREWPVRAGKYGLAEHVAVPAAARRAGAELLHEPHYTLPLGWSGPSVVTIHDLIHIRFAHLQRPGVALYARLVAGAAVRRARVVACDSEATRRDVQELLGAPAERLRVVPLGVSPGIARAAAEETSRFRAARGLPGDYVLYVGARKRHKNLELLLRAWATMHAGERPPLVLSGKAFEPLARLAALLRVGESLHFARELHGEAELSCLYSGASLLVQPSLAEGFGLPPLEAMACGTPVLASDAGSLPEVLGDAAVLLPPREPAAWAAEIVRLLSDQAARSGLVARGRARAAGFTWERTAERTRAIYAEALGATA